MKAPRGFQKPKPNLNSGYQKPNSREKGSLFH